ncbi:putative oxidoreductase, aryl-alcohol dehydrogenase like protein [Burkholderiales bacterium JOSHI_001]|nr:putative oxidoreductase, aryl-alcohol dehydrogenase like protein [Burkholderiales bacterium JOSHI_001]
MKLNPLGKSQLMVSRLCLGTMMFGDQTDAAEAGRIVAHAQEHGVNFIDTADVYTRGASETMVGGLIRAQRHHWVLATKLGNAMTDALPNTSRYSRSWVMRACEDSLRRLGTEHIDIYYLHRDFNGMNLEEPLRALEALLRDGKIRYWGVSNFRGWRIAELVHMARQLNMPGPVVCQPYYNLLNRMPEVEILEACAHHGIGVVPYSPIARGVLRASTRRAKRRRQARGRRARTPASCRPNGAKNRCRSPSAWPPIAPPRVWRWRTSPPPGCWPTGRSARSSPGRARWRSGPIISGRWTARSAPKTRRWWIHWWRPATPARRATTTRPTR